MATENVSPDKATMPVANPISGKPNGRASRAVSAKGKVKGKPKQGISETEAKARIEAISASIRQSVKADVEGALAIDVARKTQLDRASEPLLAYREAGGKPITETIWSMGLAEIVREEYRKSYDNPDTVKQRVKEFKVLVIALTHGRAIKAGIASIQAFYSDMAPKLKESGLIGKSGRGKGGGANARTEAQKEAAKLERDRKAAAALLANPGKSPAKSAESRASMLLHWTASEATWKLLEAALNELAKQHGVGA